MSQTISKRLHSFFNPNDQPTACSYCDELKPVLFIRPIATSILGELNITLNNNERNNWTCMECYEKFITNSGHQLTRKEF